MSKQKTEDMTDSNGKDYSDSRDNKGRFTPGNPGGPGRKERKDYDPAEHIPAIVKLGINAIKEDPLYLQKLRQRSPDKFSTLIMSLLQFAEKVENRRYEREMAQETEKYEQSELNEAIDLIRDWKRVRKCSTKQDKQLKAQAQRIRELEKTIAELQGADTATARLASGPLPQTDRSVCFEKEGSRARPALIIDGERIEVPPDDDD